MIVAAVSAPMSDERRVVRADDREWTETEHGETAFRRAQLGAAAGGEKLGCSLYELPPGKRSWPLHYHTANEEAFYVLSGEGLLRTGDVHRTKSDELIETDGSGDGDGDGIDLAPGDYVACSVGEDGAHQMVNDGDEPLRYLALSTMEEPDITIYPESGKVGLFAGAAPGGPKAERTLSKYVSGEEVDYWE